MKLSFLFKFFIFLVSPSLLAAQKADTVQIRPSDINTKVLIPGTHRYLVYFKNGKDSSRKNYQIWSRIIEFTQYKGLEVISIKQRWENNDTAFHTVNTLCERKTFATLYQEAWFRPQHSAVFDFMSRSAFFQGTSLSDTDTAAARKKMWDAFKLANREYVLNWHLDLEVFPTLPYQLNRTFMINFYDPGFGPPKLVAYSVSGEGSLLGYDNNPVECWLLSHSDGTANKEVFWVSKKTKEVLQLEQEFNGRFRYKIKLPFSN